MNERQLCVKCRRPLTSSEVSGYCDDCDDGKDQIERLQDRIKELEEAAWPFAVVSFKTYARPYEEDRGDAQSAQWTGLWGDVSKLRRLLGMEVKP